MDLNNIQLNTCLLTGLYGSTLIDHSADNTLHGSTAISADKPPIPTGQKSGSAPLAPKYLGNNQKNVLIGVHYADTANLPDAQLDFLTHLLKACKLGLMDVAIININNYNGISYDDILRHFNSTTILLFGITPQAFGLPFEIPPYQVQQFANTTIIHAPALQSLQDDKTAKSKLWMGLKRIFAV